MRKRKPKHHSCDEALADKADAIAAERGWLKEDCSCDPDGVHRSENSNNPMGIGEIDPCPLCAGYGWVYPEYEEAPMVRSVPELVALAD